VNQVQVALPGPEEDQMALDYALDQFYQRVHRHDVIEVEWSPL
jgi:hypothetical protein